MGTNFKSRVDKIFHEAKSKKLWIYDPSYKRWYTPEHFLHVFLHVDGEEAFFNGLQIRHPSEGIAAGFERLKQTQDKLREFAKAVVEYYGEK